MKRNQEVSIIIQSLLENGLLQERQTDRARSVVKEAFKEIRRVRYEERQEKGGDMLDIKKSNRRKVYKSRKTRIKIRCSKKCFI